MSTTDTTPSALPVAQPLATLLVSPPVYEWKDLPWKHFQRQTFKLQTRIYRASGRGDVKTVHRLQRLLMKSWAARCLAVRKVTQDNQGKKTAGVDGVKALPPGDRLRLAASLTTYPSGKPVRQVWIPKPGKPEQRPLGIPTMRDRAAQALVKLALEPEWEARFEPNSFGFRPGRSVHDALVQIHMAVCKKAKYVLDADIAARFDRINHEALLHKLHPFPALRRVIRGWLRAGVVDAGQLFPTDEGTPQGGVISPLLANVALHGLEAAVAAHFPEWQNRQRVGTPLVVRYADDFVVLHHDLAVIEQVQQFVNSWLSSMGLELKPSKTRIAHTLFPHEGRAGFDFLGFTIRQFSMGKTHRNKLGTGFKTIIRPSADAQKQHLAKIAELIRRHQQVPQTALVEHLNRKIVGWAHHNSRQVSKRVFSRLDHQVYLKLKRWAERRHPTKSRSWVRSHYWHTRGDRNWVFGPRNGIPLALHASVPVRPYVKVRGAATPSDGDWAYWASRLGQHPELPTRVATLLKRQNGRRARCGLFLTGEDLPEVDHITPKHLGGIDAYFNWPLLHRHCHDQKTAADGSYRQRSSEVPVPRAK